LRSPQHACTAHTLSVSQRSTQNGRRRPRWRFPSADACSASGKALGGGSYFGWSFGRHCSVQRSQATMFLPGINGMDPLDSRDGVMRGAQGAGRDQRREGAELPAVSRAGRRRRLDRRPSVRTGARRLHDQSTPPRMPAGDPTPPWRHAARRGPSGGAPFPCRDGAQCQSLPWETALTSRCAAPTSRQEYTFVRRGGGSRPGPVRRLSGEVARPVTPRPQGEPHHTRARAAHAGPGLTARHPRRCVWPVPS
jgi:hypothetical protein